MRRFLAYLRGIETHEYTWRPERARLFLAYLRGIETGVGYVGFDVAICF